MATKSVRKLAAGANQVSGLNTSRYEKGAVAFGVIEAADWDTGDVLSFDEVNAVQIIQATIILHTATPVVLDVTPATDLSQVLELDVTGDAKISYVIHYIRGAGKLLKVLLKD